MITLGCGETVGAKAIRYGPFARFADWWHGWRDGRHGVPRRTPGRRLSTPHREVLIRHARDAFEFERLALEAARGRARELVAAAKVRLDGAEERLRAAEEELVAVPLRPSPEELARRRLGEDSRPTTVVAQRRAREHDRRRWPLVRMRDAAAAERDRCATELAALQDAVARDLEVAAARVRRIHEHSHRRLATYRRQLVRSHPEGAKLDWEFDRVIPHGPAWADPSEPEPVAKDPLPEPPRGDMRVVAIGETTRIGTAPEPDVVDLHLEGLLVASVHATLQRSGQAFTLRDHGRGGPTEVNGQQIRGQAAVGVGDRFRIGRYDLLILSATELEIGRVGPPSLVVAELSATTRGKVRLDRMTFSQREATVLAILGPSGAGKSSLFQALLGEMPADSGELYFGRQNLATHGAQIRTQLGFVPQDDSLYRTLTVRTLLLFSDRLRSPHRRHDRAARITQVCRDLDLRELDKRVEKLSGGQRKRVSVALELLADPPLLMLDEPTSGLDPGMDNEIMGILRTMAKGAPDDDHGPGRTVVVVTHSVDNLHLADQVLLLAPDGRPVYLGDAKSLLETFAAKGLTSGSPQVRKPTYADLMKALLREPQATDQWVLDYHRGPEAAAAREHAAEAAKAAPDEAPPHRRGSPVVAVRQFPWLFLRQWFLLLARAPVIDVDWNRGPRAVASVMRGVLVVAMPLLIAVVGAAIAGVVAAPDALRTGPFDAATSVSLLVTLCMLAGQSLTYSDIVAEQDVIRREHRTGTALASVVLAKWVVFAVLAVAQAFVITVIFTGWRGAPGTSVVFSPTAELFADLALLSVAAMSSGLLVSAVATKLEQAVVMSTGLAIAQVAFNGWTADLTSGLSRFFAMALPSRWGFAAAASTVDLRALAPTAPPDELWRHTAEQWWVDAFWLSGLTVAFVALTIIVLWMRLPAADTRPGRTVRRWVPQFARVPRHALRAETQ